MSHTSISNLNINIVKDNNNIDVNELLPISDCKSFADNKLTERVTYSRHASRTLPCVDLMGKNIPRVLNHIYGPRIVENGVRNYFDNGKNTRRLIGFKVESQGSIAIHDIPLTYEFERFFHSFTFAYQYQK